MKFIGSVFEEFIPGTANTVPSIVIRGSIEVLAGGSEGPSRRRYFASFEEMKKIVEEEYTKEAHTYE